MSQDLLSAIGARLEAQLNARDTRVRSIEDSVKAAVSANPPAPFTLLPDGTKQFGYAPAAPQADVQPAVPTAAQAENVSDAAAPIAALLSATARIFTANASSSASTTAAEPKALQPIVAPAVDTAAAEEPAAPVVFSAVNSFMEAVFAKPAVLTAPMAEPSFTTASTVSASATSAAADKSTGADVASANSATASSGAASSVAASSVAAEVATTSNAAITSMLSTTASATATSATLASVATAATVTSPTTVTLGYSMLADGTKQFGFAPSGGLVNTGGVNKTPPVPTDFGVGATMRRRGVMSDKPITVTRVGDGVVFANFTDEQGTREMPFYPNQMDLLTAAP